MYSPQASSDSDSLTDVEETTPLVPTSVKGMNIQEISCFNLLGFGGLGGFYVFNKFICVFMKERSNFTRG